MTVEISSEIRDAAVSGVINILIQPEYGNDYLKEIIRSVVSKDVDITDDMIEAVDELMMARMQELAVTLVPELEESRQGHWDFLNKQG
jgi:hypothetical protein